MRPCPNCGKDVNPNARFCPNCAFDMTKAPQNPAYAETQVVQSSACPNCGATVAPNAKFCPNCASPIAGGVAAAGGKNYPGGPNYPPGANYPPPQGAGYPAQGYGGPAYAPAAKSKLPIIIGAIVLLLLIGGGVAAYFLWFNKTDSVANSNTSTASTNRSSTPTPSESPGKVAEKLLRALERADANTVRGLVAKSMQGNVPDLVEEASNDIQQHGGIDSITITDEKVDGDTASLRFAIKYKDGETKAPERMGFVKEDGVWKLKDI
jgi:RNA polymerase subunit RPABC4/transcription elongation factor Spt4